jgi:hypothetical protein
MVTEEEAVDREDGTPCSGRELHCYVRRQIEEALGDRPWLWLAKASGVAPSTLSTQLNRPKFSLDVLARVAHALRVDIAYLLPGNDRSKPVVDNQVRELLLALESAVAQAKVRYGDRAGRARTKNLG